MKVNSIFSGAKGRAAELELLRTAEITKIMSGFMHLFNVFVSLLVRSVCKIELYRIEYLDSGIGA
ncbi:MAG: hypothetical protein Tsb009_03880 [Planctomycetaceae bacterium]